MKKFYLTTTLPYVNAAPHLGFALEIIQADIIARYHRDMLGEEVIFNTGTDEHGQKIYDAARKEGIGPQAYADGNAAKFEELKKKLDVRYDRFIRTTDPAHVRAAQEFWRRCRDAGYIEQGMYRVKYCVGCELEKTDSELVDGKCPLHPSLEIQHIEEENYFFKWSAFGGKLLSFYREHPDFVVPEFRFHEIQKFVEGGLHDFSISRQKAKMPWGVPVPDDDAHVMYVWFDALVSYISTLGWPDDAKTFAAFWGEGDLRNAIQVAGKDNIRQQAAMWQAMLMAANLPLSKQVIIHGFVTSGGEKMSKTQGNVINPFDIVDRYGTDALRFWVAKEAHPFEDSDFTIEKFEESYTANLSNGLGNLVSRVVKMAAQQGVTIDEKTFEGLIGADGDTMELQRHLDAFEIQKAAQLVWKRIADADRYIQEHEPFRLVKVDVAAATFHIGELLKFVWIIGSWLSPFMPHTSKKILAAVREPRLDFEPLFPRI